MKLHDIAQQAMAKLEKTGAQQYACSLSTASRREFSALQGEFNLLRTTIDNALSLTIIKDNKKGSVAVNAFDEASLDKAVADCLAVAESAEADPAWELAKGETRSFKDGAPDGDMDKLFARSQELLEDIATDYPALMVEEMIVTHVREESLYLNSLGARYDRLTGAYGANVMFTGHEGDETSSFDYTGLSTDKLDTSFIAQSDFRSKMAASVRSVKTISPEGKKVGSVVFTPGCAGTILSYLLSGFVGGGVILEGTSPWKNKLGEQVVDPALSISASPLHPDVVAAERYTSDGFVSQNYDIIKDGKLEAFMLSQYVANKVGGKRAPNGSMNLVVAPGDKSLEELIAGIDYGLLVGRFSGGNPSSNGDFSGVAKNSFLIENGQIGPAVSETMISGNLASMMKKLRGLGKDRVKDGDSLLPAIAVDGITISGK